MPSPSPIASARATLLALLVGSLILAGFAPLSAAAAQTPSFKAKDRKASSSLTTRQPRRAQSRHGKNAAKGIQVGTRAAAAKKNAAKRSSHEGANGNAGSKTSTTKTTTSAPPTTTTPPSTTTAPVTETAPTPAPVVETAPAPEPTAPTETPAPVEPATPAEAEAANIPSMESSFENGFNGWNTAGLGEAMPTLDKTMARTGTTSCKVVLTGNQSRSELIFGGNGSGSLAGTAEFHPGDEDWYGFSFYINQMVYGKPGAHNLFMQFKSNGEGSPLFGLQLWNYAGKKGLWSAGTGMEVNKGGERFLSPVTEKAWHDVQIHFRASETGTGFYEIYLDGNLVDSQTNVTNIVPGAHFAYIKDGLYRNGETAAGTSEIHLDSAKLGKTQASVLPS